MAGRRNLAGRSIEQAETQDRSYQVKQTCLQASPHRQRSAQAGICWQTHGVGRHMARQTYGQADTRAWQTHGADRHTFRQTHWSGRHADIRNILPTKRFKDTYSATK